MVSFISPLILSSGPCGFDVIMVVVVKGLKIGLFPRLSLVVFTTPKSCCKTSYGEKQNDGFGNKLTNANYEFIITQ